MEFVLLRKLAGGVLIVVNLAICAGFLIRFVNGWPTFDVYHLDLDVYRIGAQTWRNGGELYGQLPATASGAVFPFTYPPIAAVLLAPATLVPLSVAGALLNALTMVLLLVVIGLVLRSVAPGRSHRLLAAAVLPVAIYLEPIQATLSYGQINVLLMVLVVADCLVKTPRLPSGVLVGIAAAVKLTPAAFILFFLLRKDYRAAVSAGVAFAAATAAGFLFAWSDSVRYWTGTLYDTQRIGTPHYAGNQSLPAALARFGIDAPTRTAVWLLGAALIVGLAAIGMRRAFAAELPALALGVNACAALVISPVSWTHHWVWMVPVLIVLGSLWRAPVAAFLAGCGVLLFMIAPMWWFPETLNREYEWNIKQHLAGSSYLYFAALVLIVVAVGSGLTRMDRRTMSSSRRTEQGSPEPAAARENARSPGRHHAIISR
jgi:alpha-1,2-mannosyltransferase